MNELTHAERIELSYLQLKGFQYLVRNEIGSVEVFVNRPHRDKETNYTPFGRSRGGYNIWIETKTPIPLEEQLRCKHVELGNYDFIQWTDEPMRIDDILTYTFEEVVELLKKSKGKDYFYFKNGTYSEVDITKHREQDYLVVAWGNESFYQPLTAFSGERLERLKQATYKKK